MASAQVSGYVVPANECNDMIRRMVVCETQIGSKGADQKMSQYIYKRTQAGHHIINLQKTLEKIHMAARVLAAYPKESICAVGSRQYAMRPVLKFAHYTGAKSVAGRWTPGFLTNQVTKQFTQPRVVIVADPSADHQVISEAAKNDTIVVAFCNTDNTLNNVDIAIPANNKGSNSLGLIFWLLAREVLYLRGAVSRAEKWSVLPDMFMYKELLETPAIENAAEEQTVDAIDAERHQDANPNLYPEDGHPIKVKQIHLIVVDVRMELPEKEPCLTLYDIASAPPRATTAPNPWKTRYALNLKKVPYRTEWVEIDQIEAVRKNLGVPANRTHPDGSPYYTLPVLHDHATGKLVGDSFEIALYLDASYPTDPPLFHTGTVGLTAAFNAQVDAVFTKFVALCDQLPFTEVSLAKAKAIFAKRHGGVPAEAGDVQIDKKASSLKPNPFSLEPLGNEGREALMTQFEVALGELHKAFLHTGATTDYFFRTGGTAAEHAQTSGRKDAEVWLDANGPTYADLIVGAWLCTYSCSLRSDLWERMRNWQGGFWGKFHDKLEPLREIK